MGLSLNQNPIGVLWRDGASAQFAVDAAGERAGRVGLPVHHVAPSSNARPRVPATWKPDSSIKLRGGAR